jgi:glycerol-3-phosphate acyltransferase PlsY
MPVLPRRASNRCQGTAQSGSHTGTVKLMAAVHMPGRIDHYGPEHGSPAGTRRWGLNGRGPSRLRPSLAPLAAIPAGFVAGSVPFSNLVAHRTRGVDLRNVGTGTVSGTALYQQAGFLPLAAAGIFEVAKGALGPALAGRNRPATAAAAAAAAVAGHDWSPFLGGAGGRGLSPAIGGLAATAPAGAVTLLAGLAAGRLAGETAVGCLVADLALFPIVKRAHGSRAAWAAAAVVAPMLIKRVTGNAPPARPSAGVYMRRFLLDRDEWAKPLASTSFSTS